MSNKGAKSARAHKKMQPPPPHTSLFDTRHSPRCCRSRGPVFSFAWERTEGAGAAAAAARDGKENSRGARRVKSACAPLFSASSALLKGGRGEKQRGEGEGGGEDGRVGGERKRGRGTRGNGTQRAFRRFRFGGVLFCGLGGKGGGGKRTKRTALRRRNCPDPLVEGTSQPFRRTEQTRGPCAGEEARPARCDEKNFFSARPIAPPRPPAGLFFFSARPPPERGLRHSIGQAPLASFDPVSFVPSGFVRVVWCGLSLFCLFFSLSAFRSVGLFFFHAPRGGGGTHSGASPPPPPKQTWLSHTRTRTRGLSGSGGGRREAPAPRLPRAARARARRRGPARSIPRGHLPCFGLPAGWGGGRAGGGGADGGGRRERKEGGEEPIDKGRRKKKHQPTRERPARCFAGLAGERAMARSRVLVCVLTLAWMSVRLGCGRGASGRVGG